MLETPQVFSQTIRVVNQKRRAQPGLLATH